MTVLITNEHTIDKETKAINLQKWFPEQDIKKITLSQVADKFIKQIAKIYPKAYKIVHNSKNHISIMDGKNSNWLFDIRKVEELKDNDKSFLW